MIDVYEVFKEEIWMPSDCTNYIWYEQLQGEIFWNTQNNIEHLKDGDGCTYSGCVMNGAVVKGFYVLHVLEDGCGSVDQYIFDLRNKKEF